MCTICILGELGDQCNISLQLIVTSKVSSDCEGCAVCEKSMKPTQPPLQPIPYSLRNYGNIFKSTFSARCRLHPTVHSKWPETAAPSTAVSSAIIQILEEPFSRRKATTDHISCHTNVKCSCRNSAWNTFAALCKNPQCNGGVEMLNRVIKESLGRYSRKIRYIDQM